MPLESVGGLDLAAALAPYQKALTTAVATTSGDVAEGVGTLYVDASAGPVALTVSKANQIAIKKVDATNNAVVITVRGGTGGGTFTIPNAGYMLRPNATGLAIVEAYNPASRTFLPLNPTLPFTVTPPGLSGNPSPVRLDLGYTLHASLHKVGRRYGFDIDAEYRTAAATLGGLLVRIGAGSYTLAQGSILGLSALNAAQPIEARGITFEPTALGASVPTRSRGLINLSEGMTIRPLNLTTALTGFDTTVDLPMWAELQWTGTLVSIATTTISVTRFSMYFDN